MAVPRCTAVPKRLRKKVAIVLVDNNGLARGRGASRLKHWYPSDRSPVLPKAVTGSGGW